MDIYLSVFWKPEYHDSLIITGGYMNIYKRMNECKKGLHSIKLTKSGINDYTKQPYFLLSDFLPAILDLCDQLELNTCVSFPENEAILTITNIDTPEEQIIVHSPFGSAELKGCHEVQNIGAVETYQRRYLYMAAFDIMENDILDSGVMLNFSDGVHYAEEILIINGCETLEDLTKVWSTLYRKLENDKVGLAAITKAKDDKKRELSE